MAPRAAAEVRTSMHVREDLSVLRLVSVSPSTCTFAAFLAQPHPTRLPPRPPPHVHADGPTKAWRLAGKVKGDQVSTPVTNFSFVACPPTRPPRTTLLPFSCFCSVGVVE